MKVIDRMKFPTPKLFRILRNIGLSLAAASAAIFTSPITLLASLITAVGYIAVGGSVPSAVSQATVEN